MLDSPEDHDLTTGNGTVSVTSRSDSMRANKRMSKKIRQSTSKLNMGEATDDVHVCIMCLRAIMNHQVPKIYLEIQL